MYYAVFITPDKTLNKEIYKWKNKIKKDFPDSDHCYTSHPPHLTVFKLESEHKDKLILEFNKFSNKLNAFDLVVVKKNIFWNDPITKKNTIFYQADKSEHISNIQLNLASSLSKYKTRREAPVEITSNEIMLNSYKKYGFPFVGQHWIPHFSISSINLKRTNKFYKSFILDFKKHSFKVENVSIWEINGEKHEKIKEIQLNVKS